MGQERKGCGYFFNSLGVRLGLIVRKDELYRVTVPEDKDPGLAIAELTMEKGGILFGGVDPKTGEIFVTDEVKPVDK